MNSALEPTFDVESKSMKSGGSGLFSEKAIAQVTEAFRMSVSHARAETEAAMNSLAAPSDGNMEKARSIARQIHELEGQLRAVLRPSAGLTLAESAH